MHDTSRNYLLMIEPQNRVKEPIVNDAYTAKMEMLVKKAKHDPPYKGFHICACGERSVNYDLIIGKYVTNSLAVHYLRCHRSEVPPSELEKLRTFFL